MYDTSCCFLRVSFEINITSADVLVVRFCGALCRLVGCFVVSAFLLFPAQHTAATNARLASTRTKDVQFEAPAEILLCQASKKVLLPSASPV